MTAFILALILKYSSMNNVDPHLVMSIVQIESSYKVDAKGKAGEVGLMQLHPKFFKGYTKKQLQQPEINIKLGVEHLAYSIKHCKFKRDISGVVCYNYGVNGASKLKHPKSTQYYRRVAKVYNQLLMYVRSEE